MLFTNGKPSDRLKRAHTLAKRMQAFKKAAEESKGVKKAKYNRLAKLCEQRQELELKNMIDMLQKTLSPEEYRLFESIVEVIHKA